MSNLILVGSTYFFKDIKDFKSEDIDRVLIVDNPKGFNYVRQTSGQGTCLFEWKRMTPEEYIAYSLNSKLAMSVGKFLVPEFCKEIGFTIEHLKKLEPVFNRMDSKHKYEQIIFNAYLQNNDFILTDEQRDEAYKSYKKAREI